MEYCKNSQFFEFLGKFGKALITNNNIYTNISEIQQVSKDLNIKLMIYDSDELVSEGICYEFPNPPTICIISQKKTDNEYNFPNSFCNRTLQTEPIIESHRRNDERKRLINSFGWSLTEITNKTLLNRQSKDWIHNILSKYPMACHEHLFLRQLKKAKMQVGKIPELRTEKMEISVLKRSHSYMAAMPELFSKFASIPEDDIMPELYVKGEGDNAQKQVSKVEEIKIEPEVDQIPIPQANEAGIDLGGVHCKKCLEDPFQFGNFECDCLLSNDCMKASLMSGACVACQKAISQNDQSNFSVYFS